MLRILGKRYPLSKVILLPVRVQGQEAPKEISRAIDYANAAGLCDVLIVGRGGGSLEDLWAFNDELVARTIYRSQIPVVSAVGHEPDVTISDFVADLRAATPSNAAELTAPDQAELKARLEALQKQMAAALQRRAQIVRSRLDALRSRPVLKDPTRMIQDRRLRLDQAFEALCSAQNSRVQRDRAAFSRLTAALDAMSPLKVLSRGYAIVSDENQTPITRAADAVPGQKITITFRDASVSAQITGV